MCGIWSIFSDNTISKDVMKKHLSKFDSIKNRGPDKTILRKFDKAVFGFQRLAIIDESYISDQPFIRTFNNGDKGPVTMTMICNGEIFNYKELIRDHELTDLQTDSDCEVILSLYEKYDIEHTLSLLRGEFAFIINTYFHNTNTNLQVVARDQFGVRPLFYNTIDNMLFFGSTLTSVGKNGRVFEPGTWMTVHNIKQPEIHTYYDCAIVTVRENDLQLIYRNVTEILINSVRRRTISDRPIGVTLSGGLDSSLVAGIIVNVLGIKHLQTFSTGLFGSVDLHHAGQVANFLDTKHHEIPKTKEYALHILDIIIIILETWDITTIRASIWQYIVAYYISTESDVKVILNGDGADELMMGYKENYFAPSALVAMENVYKRLKNIHKYDGLRMDRCISSLGLEARPSFLDIDFANYFLSIDPELIVPIKGERMEKDIIRQAFLTHYPNILPTEILTRPKEAFSDGVSEKDSTESWFNIIIDYIESKVPDLEYNNRDPMFESCLTKEAYYYKKTYYEAFSNNFDVIPGYWLPNWIDTGGEPSARVLAL